MIVVLVVSAELEKFHMYTNIKGLWIWFYFF